jgi:hypothetical protein
MYVCVWGVCTYVCGGVCMCLGCTVCMYVCGDVWMCVEIYACVLECIYIGTRGRKETGSAKGNWERERKPLAQKEIKSAKV